MFKGALLISTLLLVSAFESSLIEQKYWLTTCALSGCSMTFNACFGCYGERACKQCITSIKPECSVCADDIFDQGSMETVNGGKYLLCDANDSFQVNICHLHCRGRYFQTGQCIRLNNVPICNCVNQPDTSSSSTTTGSVTDSTSSPTSQTSMTSSSTSYQSTTSNVITPTFNGTLNINFTISTGFQKIFALPNGELLRGSYSNEIEVWDVNQGVIKRKLTTVHYYPFLFGLLSNGDLVVGYLESKAFLIWDISHPNRENVKRVLPSNDLISCLTVLDNDDLAIGQQSVNYDILIRDSQSGIIKKRLVGHQNSVYDIITLSNGNLASCSADGTVRIWDASSATLLNTFVHLTPVFSITLLNNFELIAGLSDGSVEVWNLATGDPQGNFYIHTTSICRYRCIHVLKNGLVISGSHDFELSVWNPRDGYITQTLRNHRTPIYQLELSNSGHLITSSSSEIAFWF